MKASYLALVLSGSLFALPVDKVIKKEEQQQMGINKLTPQQKQALERWLDTWTRKVIEQAPSYHASFSIEQWVEEWPEYAKPIPKKGTQLDQARQEANQKIYTNNDGQEIELYDGSVWKIRIIDASVAKRWLRGEKIEISTQKRNIRSPYILKNPEREEEVGATRIRPPNPKGMREEESESHYQGSLPIQSIDVDGKTVTTTDNKTWDIAPIDQDWVKRQWKKHDRIRVERSKDALYRYSIHNLDSGGKVLANPKK